ncbi:MAG: tyrosine-type recombinase/integrase [Ruminococcus sp.]|nr:tyrosine-type recombinase/integrase [Ruminococcus sp.]
MRKTGKEPKGFSSPSGIPNLLEKFTAHQLRHTYCTMLYFAGVDILTASKLMGHSNVRITLEIYTHLDERYKQLNIDKYNQYIANNNQTLNISNCLS